MNRMQKIAWFFVITISIAVASTLLATIILYVKIGWPRALVGLAFMGLVGLGGLSSLIFPRRKDEAVPDERDHLIKKNAAMTGFVAAFLVCCLACMIPFFVLGPGGSISVRWLPLIWGSVFITAFFAQSVAILVQYGRGTKDDASVKS